MDFAETAVSLAIVRLHDSSDIINREMLADQISVKISNLQSTMKARRNAQLTEGRQRNLQLFAWKVKDLAEEFLVQLLQDHKSKSQLVRFFLRMNRARARKRLAEDFKAKVELLFQEFPQSCPTVGNGLQDNNSNQRNLENMRQRVEYVSAIRETYVEELRKQLFVPDISLRVIAVVGKQHCGKTALVRHVFNMLNIEHHFDCRAWVHVTCLRVESWMETLLVDILKQMPVREELKDLKHKNKEQLLGMLQKVWMDKRYLIVLDDWGDARLISEFLGPLGDSVHGSRVIVTTTTADMQKFADPWMPDLPSCPDLTEEECEALLLGSFIGEWNPTVSERELMMQILRNCNRSPPAISLLGGLLSTAEGNREALVEPLGNSPTLNHFMCLSFDELPYRMKPCVLYMALFPEESEVPTRRLFGQWAAEGLLAEASDRSMTSAEDCFRELERRNLVHVVRRKVGGSARSCRMPAFLHKFFRQKAEDFGLLHIHYSLDSVAEGQSRVNNSNAEQSAQRQPNQAQNEATGHYDYMVRCFRSFASFNTCAAGTQAREIEVLLNDRKAILLRVLDLEGIYKPVVPEKFGNVLSNLRYLGLRRTALDSIPESVGNLLLLETLDLKHTNITEVTSTIWKAKNLRHLYLSEASFSKSIQCHISSGESAKLETLWGLFIETDQSPLLSVLAKLRSLKKLGVTCRPGAVKAVTECISKLVGLESLRLRSRDLFGQPADLDICNMTGLVFLSNLYLLGSLRSVQNLGSVLPRRLKVLTLSMSRWENDPMPVLQRLNELIVLKLLARSCCAKELRCEAGFPNLHVLRLWGLKKIKSLVVREGAMGNVKELEIRHCKKLETVDGLLHIQSLKSVSLTGVDEDLARSIRVPLHTLVKKKELLSKGRMADETDED